MFAGGDSHKMIWVMAKLRLRDNNIVKSVLCVQLSLRKKQNMLKQVSSSATFHGETRFVSVESPSQDGEITRISFWDSFFFQLKSGPQQSWWHQLWNNEIPWNSMKFSVQHFTGRDAMPRLFWVFGHAHAFTERAGGCDSHRPSMVPLDFITWFLWCLKLRWWD